MKRITTDPTTWRRAVESLLLRRIMRGISNDNITLDPRIRDYETHLMKCGVGKVVLDVGCGDQFIKRCLPDNVKYYGLDPFPVELGNKVFHESIESDYIPVVLGKLGIETVCAMAMLDGCLDFDKAIENIKALASKNVIILTGVDIEVDQYHTHKLTLEDFDQRFSGWKNTHREELSKKVWLLNYDRP